MKDEIGIALAIGVYKGDNLYITHIETPSKKVQEIIKKEIGMENIGKKMKKQKYCDKCGIGYI